MPKKKIQETPEDQSERFRKEAQKLIDAGALNPTEAEKRLNVIVSHAQSKSFQDAVKTPPESGPS